MADSAVAVTAGTGTNIDTRTEATNGNHRQVVVLGDPATNAGVAPVDATNGLAVQVIPALPAGTNNIGDVDVLSVVPGTGATDLGKAEDAAHSSGDTGVMVLAVRRDSVAAGGADGDYVTLNIDANGRLYVTATVDAALPAGTNLIGKISASHETSTLYNGTTALTPKFAKISCSSSGNNEIVAAVTGKKIRVISWDVSPSDAVNFKWRTASTDITGLYYGANAGNGVSKPWNPLGYFETVSDEALNLNLSGATAVGGSLVYVEV